MCFKDVDVALSLPAPNFSNFPRGGQQQIIDNNTLMAVDLWCVGLRNPLPPQSPAKLLCKVHCKWPSVNGRALGKLPLNLHMSVASWALDLQPLSIKAREQENKLLLVN